jgi:hypothetical protein
MKSGYESGIGAWFDLLPFTKACGTGSFPHNNIEYCNTLKHVLSKYLIRSVVDYGCGNLETYKGNIDWNFNPIKYTGYDANIQCVNTLKNTYPLLNFEYAKLNEIPNKNADALIIKDVLIHWFDQDIKHFFENVFNKYEYVIYMHSTKNQGYIDDKNKRESYEIKNPKNRKGLVIKDGKLPKPPKGWEYWKEGCYGYHAVDDNLLPLNNLIFSKNILGDSMKTFMVFKNEY